MGCHSLLNRFSPSAYKALFFRILQAKTDSIPIIYPHLPQTPAAHYKLPYPQCSAPAVLLSANLCLRSTVDTALEIWHLPTRELCLRKIVR